MDQAGQGGWQVPSNSLPSLALKPPSRLGGASAKPKLSLSGFGTPASSPSPHPTPLQTAIPPPSIPARRPALLNAPSASGLTPSRGSDTPSLKLAIPGTGLGGLGGGAGFTGGHDYPEEEDFSDLRTPMAGDGEDRNPTIMARGNHDDGESSYGYGLVNNGLGNNGDRMVAMTHDIRQALASRSRFDPMPPLNHHNSAPTPVGPVRSRPSSRSNSTAGSRRGSGVATPQMDDLAALQNLSINNGSGEMSRTDSEQSLGVKGEGIPIINPEDLTLVKRLGEGAGGSVDMVRDKNGRVMAKKVSPTHLVAGPVTDLAGDRPNRQSTVTQTALNRAGNSQHMRLALHCPTFRFIPRRPRYPDWYPHGVLRSRLPGQFARKDEAEGYEVFRTCPRSNRIVGIERAGLSSSEENHSPGYQAFEYRSHARWGNQVV